MMLRISRWKTFIPSMNPKNSTALKLCFGFGYAGDNASKRRSECNCQRNVWEREGDVPQVDGKSTTVARDVDGDGAKPEPPWEDQEGLRPHAKDLRWYCG